MHSNIADVISKLLKNKDCKERVLQLIRLSVGLNQEKTKNFHSGTCQFRRLYHELNRRNADSEQTFHIKIL